jgi:hypothetical protein
VTSLQLNRLTNHSFALFTFGAGWMAALNSPAAFNPAFLRSLSQVTNQSSSTTEVDDATMGSNKLFFSADRPALWYLVVI